MMTGLWRVKGVSALLNRLVTYRDMCRQWETASLLQLCQIIQDNQDAVEEMFGAKRNLYNCVNNFKMVYNIF